jgi:DNA-binding MarR family transcriptional regulator
MAAYSGRTLPRYLCFLHFGLAPISLSRQHCHGIDLRVGVESSAINSGEIFMARARAKDPSLHVLESLITYRLTRIADTLVRAASQVYRARHGVTLTELRLLATIGRHQPLAVNEASRLTGIDKAWVSRSLEALVKRKLVTRQPHPSDSRIVLLSLTPRGKAKVHRIVPLAVVRNERLLGALSKKKRAAFEEILDQLQVRVEELLAHPDANK